MRRVRAFSASLGRHPRGVLLLWAVGAALIVAASLSLADPGLVMFALDPELVAVLVLSSVTLLRASAAGAVVRAFVALVARSHGVQVRRRRQCPLDRSARPTNGRQADGRPPPEVEEATAPAGRR